MATISIASIQSGIQGINAADGTNIDITISSVDTSKAFADITIKCSDNEGRVLRHAFTAELTSATNLRLTRYSSSSAKYVQVKWTVIEFATGIASIQSGLSNRTSATTNVTISSVSLTKSFSITSLRTNDNLLLPDVTCVGMLTTATNLELRSAASPSSLNSIVRYFVVEFDSDADLNVQSGTISISSAQESNTATITSVDTTKTFIVHAGTLGANYTSPVPRNTTRLRLTDATTVTADRSTNGSAVDMETGYYVVELEGSGHVVKSFDVTITNGNTTPASQPSWSALSTTNTALISGWSIGNIRTDNSSHSDYPESVWANMSSNAGADGAYVSRMGTSDDIYVSGFVVDFSEGSGGTTVNANLESITVAENSASINAETSISATQETISLTGYAAAVSLNSGTEISATLESITNTTFAASINAETSISAALEQISVTENAANVNAETSISGNVENIAVTTNDATVALDVDIAATIESLALTTNSASVIIGATINANAEAITLSTLLAAINAETSISASVESIALSTYSASVSTGSSINALTESIALTTNAASIALDTVINAATESVVLTALNAQIGLGTNINASVESLTVTPNGATITLDTGISATLESVTLATFSAAITSAESALTVPGLEYTLNDNRLHFTLPVNKLHFTFSED